MPASHASHVTTCYKAPFCAVCRQDAPCDNLSLAADGAYAGRVSGTIVVGVDGSDASREALRWAAEEAALRGGAARRRACVVVHPAAAAGRPRDPRGSCRRPAGQLSAENDAARLALDEAVVEPLGAEPSRRDRAPARRGRRRRVARRGERERGSRRRRLARALRTQGRAARLREPARRRPRDVPRGRRQSARVDRSQRRGCGAAAFRDLRATGGSALADLRSCALTACSSSRRARGRDR